MKRASQTGAMHGAEAAGTRSGDSGNHACDTGDPDESPASVHCTEGLCNVSDRTELGKTRRLRLNTQRGGKEDCSHQRKEVGEEEVEQVELEEVVEPVAQEVAAREDETLTGCAFATLHHEDERFPSDTTAQINQLMNKNTRRLVVSEEGELETNHLQPHVHLEHVDHPEEALARHGSIEPREFEEEKRTFNSRTMEGETELRLQLRGTTVCDSQRGRGHQRRRGCCPELWTNDPPGATLRQCARIDPTKPSR